MKEREIRREEREKREDQQRKHKRRNTKWKCEILGNVKTFSTSQ